MSGEDSQLDRMEKLLYRIEKRVNEINGTVRSHDQTLHGPAGRGGGLADDVRALWERSRSVGTVQTKTMWTAVAAVTGVASLVVAVMIGIAT